VWLLAESPNIQADVAIGRGPEMPSRLLLPVTAGGNVPRALPPCPGLRGQPCREYQPFENAAELGDAGSVPSPGSGAVSGTQPPGSTATPDRAKTCRGGKKKAGKKKAGKKAGKKRGAGKKSRCGKKKKKSR